MMTRLPLLGTTTPRRLARSLRQGLAILLLPRPGGKAPDWLSSLMGLKPPFVPFPILTAVLIAAVMHVGLMRSSYGAILRGAGGNPAAIARAGWSLLRAKI